MPEAVEFWPRDTDDFSPESTSSLRRKGALRARDVASSILGVRVHTGKNIKFVRKIRAKRSTIDHAGTNDA